MKLDRRAFVLVVGVLLFISFGMAFSRPVNTARAQAIITLIFPTFTPTRTPTPINVGNFVWDDIDGDGSQDAGEPGLAGITVQLWNGGKTQLIDSAVTNASGIYSLTAPTPGEYRVRVLLSSGDLFTLKNNAATDQTDSDINPTGTNGGFTDIYTFGTNLISITTIDAGVIKFRTPTPTRTPTPIHLGNFIWRDTNGNGIQDSGEPGAAGVTIQLWNDAKTHLIASTVSNASGIYSLVAPVPGNYRIRVLLTSGASFAPANQGSSDLIDSDINPTGTNFGFTNTISIASNVISITSIDAGLLNYVPPTATATATATVTPTPPALLNYPIFVPVVRR